MRTIWIIRGKLAGTFQSVSDEDAQRLVDKGDAQLCDGITHLQYPDNHPQYVAPKTRRRNTARKKYPNKMMTTDAEA